MLHSLTASLRGALPVHVHSKITKKVQRQNLNTLRQVKISSWSNKKNKRKLITLKSFTRYKQVLHIFMASGGGENKGKDSK